MKKLMILMILLMSFWLIAEQLHDEGALMAILFHQTAAEYKALCYQAYNTAEDRVLLLMQEKRNKPPAIILDIDETVLGNSKYNAREVLREVEYPREFYQWIEEMQSEPVSGALEFLKLADSLEIKIFYITNRREHKKEATMGNMIKYGFPQVKADHVFCKTDESSKEGRRQKVMAEYDVLLLVGDNLIDFADCFGGSTIEERYRETEKWKEMFGRRYIILPNIMHGNWEKVIYDYEYNLSQEQLREKRLKYLEY